MKIIALAALAVSVVASPLWAEGDIDAGKKAFGKCKSCHSVIAPDGAVLEKGGKTGPNLFAVVGSPAASKDFKYSKTLKAAAEAGLIWDEAALAAYVADPRGYLKELGTDGKTKMTFKLKKGGADVAAFLASLAPAPEVEVEVEADGAAEATTD
ncbi:cytochrome C [Cognatishimia sp. SS12]|uniref:c-type cytochrome n=1 Tax=Cognatishimia sp. SS12 TaxID=2979465 RepID=UPI00232C2CA9|nr:cytochrome C [Cognatishimia sp. SS12]MDC0736834.1 cytochrome C [Cognatishimia sp. SS12]